MPVSPTQVVLAAALAVALGFVWHVEGRGRWRPRLEARFVYGVPWGTLVTVSLVVAFYLFVQGGFRNWDAPVIWAFVTWSYYYPTGLLTAGVAHGSPGHLVANMVATLTLAPIAEYAWGHYVPAGNDGPRDDRAGPSQADEETERYEGVEERDSAVIREHRPDGGSAPDGGTAPNGGFGPDGGPERRSWATAPWVRALVLFPAALLAAALVTALFSLGPGLGFSGAVFAIAGFAVLNYPFATVVAVVVTSTLGTLYRAFTQPVIRETIEVGPPTPPPWAGIGFQAHMLGFLLGVLVAVAFLSRRGRRPALERVFFGTLLLGMVQSLWLISWGSMDEYVLYQGAGVSLVLLLTVLVTLAAAGSDRPVPGVLSGLPRAPSRGHLAVVWLAVVVTGFALGVAAVVLEGQAVGLLVGALVLFAVLLAAPAIPPLVPDRWFEGPVTRRQTAFAVVAAVTLVVTAPSIPVGLVVVDDAAPDRGVQVEDYTLAYVENETVATTPVLDMGEGRYDVNRSGLILVSEERELWTIAQREEMLAFQGNETVVVGGAGWRETVTVERTGWDVLGNDTAFAVDLEVNNETTRTFESEPVRANARIDGHTVAVVPTEDGFDLRVSRDGSTVGETAVPPMGETTTVDDVVFGTWRVDGRPRIFATVDDTEVQVAAREEYH